MSKRQKMTTERFVSLSRKAYGDAYNYDQSVCNAVKDRVCVTCPIDGHGDWWPVANNHLSGKAGCPACAGNQPLSLGTFIRRASLKHNNRYDYSKVVYTNNHTPVLIRCPDHDVFPQIPMSHLAGQGCPTCAGKGLTTLARFIQLSREIHGDKFEYLDSSVRTTTGKVRLRCKSNGHEFQQKYGTHIYQKSGCPICAGRFKKTTEQFIADARAVHGDRYDYTSTDYIGKAKKVVIGCPTHGSFSQTPNTHLSGAGCPKCAADNKLVGTKAYIAKAQAVHGEKYTYENTVYSGSANNLLVTCPVHGDWSVIARSHLQNGTGCSACANTRLLTTPKFIVKAKALHGSDYDYSLVDYVNYDTPIRVLCKKHGEFIQTPDSHLQGKGCSLCANIGPSKPQLEIHEFLSQYTEARLEHRFEGSTKRYDIFLPEKNLAVEYNGLYWHSSRTQKRDTKELEKHTHSLRHGVRTIIVFQDEWKYQPHIIKNVLLSSLGLLPRIFARKCRVQQLETADVQNFYMDTHVQGPPRTHTHFGLLHGDDLVACMSFGMLRSSRYNTDPRHWELTRYASTHTVVGGASKLLKAFSSLGVADRLTSYSDVRMFSGKMYEKIGFTRVHQTRPDYYYTKSSVGGFRLHKSKFQKKHLMKLFPGCDLTKTEKEICEENGYFQVYDCGKIRWDLELTSTARN